MSCDRMLSCCSDAGRVNSLPIKSHVARHSPKSNIVAIDAVYTRSENRNPEFHELPAPEDDEIVEFTTIVATRIEALLERRGIGSGSEDEDALSRDDPGMAALYASSIRGRIAVGSNVGYRVARLGDQIDGDSLDVLQSPCCATVNGFSVHANVSIPAHDRMRLHGTPVRIIGWASAVPIERPWRNGTTAVIFEPQDFLEKVIS